MLTSPSASPILPPPWAQLLKEVDDLVGKPVDVHLLGGFVITAFHGLPRPTADVDYICVHPLDEQQHIEEIAGRQSKLHKKYGVYLQYVGVVNLPEDYEQRLIHVFPEDFRNLRIFVLEAYDLALSKLERNWPKDREDVKFLAEKVPLDPEVLRCRYETELRPYLANPEWHDGTLKLWLEEYFNRQQS